MAADDTETLGLLNYYMLEGYHHHVQTAVLEATRKFGPDPVLKLYKCLGVLAEGHIQESMRELEAIKDEQNIELAANIVLMNAHGQCRNKDDNAINALKAKIKDMQSRATSTQTFLSGYMMWHLGLTKRAKEAAEVLMKDPEFKKQGAILKGWVEITSDRDLSVKKSIRFFESGLADGNKDPFGFIGKYRYCMKMNKFSLALEAINQAVVNYHNYIPALVERMKLYLAQQDWDQMNDSAQKILSTKTRHPEALILQCLYTITQEGNYTEAVNQLGEIIQVIDRFEPQNAALYYRCAQIFSRLASRNEQILNQTLTLVERAANLNPTNTHFVNEQAYQVFLMGKHKDAIQLYNKIMSMGGTSMDALIGTLRCQLTELSTSNKHDESAISDIADQLVFFDAMNESSSVLAEVLHLKALNCRLTNGSSESIYQLLDDAREKHFKAMRGTALSADYYLKLNPEFLKAVVEELLKLCPSQPVLSGQPAPPALKLASSILDTVVHVAPGLIEILFIKAKVAFLSGDLDGSSSVLQRCLQQDITYGAAHLLMAEIHHYRGNPAATSKYLETALSYNFEIRDQPKYHLIKARTLKDSGNIVETIQSLKMALSLPGVKRPLSSVQKQKKHVPIDSNDKLSLFLDLVEAHALNNEHHEAAKVMQDAINAFQGTPEEIRVKVANADMSVGRGDVEQALSMLRSITPEQPYYIQAKEKMAEIYLTHRKDKKLYTSCYRELAESLPSPHTSLLLGDAYMRVQEPANAVIVYEDAVKRNPRNGGLASKVGQALIKTHDYKKAITYYEAALKNGQKSLRFELAELLLKLKNYPKAHRVLQEESEEVGNDLETAKNETTRLMLLAQLFRKNSKHEDELQALTKARDTQAKVLKRVQLEQPEVTLEQKKLAAHICCLLANHARSHENDTQQAIKYHKEALIYCESDTKIMMELAKLYLQTGDDESCQQYCMQALRLNETNDQASMMMADVMFNKKQYNDAIFHYEKLLEAKPDHFEALARLISLLRRAGRLSDVPRFLDMAEEKVGEGRAAMDAGFQFCKGCYEWSCGNASEALTILNRARCDTDWNEKTLEMMIRICLNPDQLTVGGEVFENLNETNQEKTSASRNNAISTAERLVKEFKSADPYKVQVMENLVLVATKHKANAERALQAFTEICQKKRDYVPAIVGMAIAYQLLKQTPRARNQLKRMSKMPWTAEDAEDFESAWLLLADLYITAGKYDMATELLKRCLDHNKSSSKAYEYLGFIYEKEQSYKDAANNYEQAWQYCNQQNPVIGYKLAFNYLKAKRFVDAIDISHKVLAANPNYPRIKREILDKARSSLRN